MSPGWNTRTTHALVARSSRITTTLTTSQRVHALALRSRMAARLARAFEVGNTARADRRMTRDAAHVGAVMPAALALEVRARGHGDLHAGSVDRVAHLGLRRDEDELQVVAERAQQVAVFGRLAVHPDLGLQRRTDDAGG